MCELWLDSKCLLCRKITITVLGNPVPQKRHRTVTRDRNGKPLPFARAYDPSRDDKRKLALMAQSQAPAKPIAEPIELKVVAVFARPRSHYRTGRFSGILRDAAPHWHTSKPDADNLMKLIKDALNGVIWRDDSLVARESIEKVYGETPMTRVEVALCP